MPTSIKKTDAAILTARAKAMGITRNDLVLILLGFMTTQDLQNKKGWKILTKGVNNDAG